MVKRAILEHYEELFYDIAYRAWLIEEKMPTVFKEINKKLQKQVSQ